MIAALRFSIHGLDNVSQPTEDRIGLPCLREAVIDRFVSLREMIGSSMLGSLLSDRKDADEQLKIEIGQKTAPWGISMSSVEIRDVAIPVALQDAMSRQAQAEREKQARVILGSAEAVIAGKFAWVTSTTTWRRRPFCPGTQSRMTCSN